MSEEQRTAVVVGAGLAGSLMAILLARRGFVVEVHERRGDPRDPATLDDGRSINLGMSARALHALRTVDLLDEVMPRTVPMRGRIIHHGDGSLPFQPYGTTDDEILHSILRRDLNVALIERAAAHPRVRFAFGSRFVGMDRDKQPLVAHVADDDGTVRAVEADILIGADGAFSRVRREMHYGERAEFSQEFLEWGYKELTIPAAADGTPRTELEALHIWPSDDGLIVAHPNLDGSLTGTLFLAHEGEPSFASLRSAEQVRDYFAGTFPDTRELMPDVVEEFTANPVGNLVTIRTSPWHYRNRVVLLGDAAHAVYPFYGQGMNAAFEDCVVLDECLDAHPRDIGAAFADFQRRRKRHTDVLSELAKENFLELRDGVRSRWRLARRRADLVLNRMLPRQWVPLYTLVSHTTVPYAEALRRAKRQDRLLALLGLAAGGLAAGGAAAAITRWSRHSRPPCSF